MSAQILENYYDKAPEPRVLEMADHFADNSRFRSSKKGYAAQLAFIERFVTPGRLLDVGSGFGGFLYIARGRGWDCFGVEISHFWGQKAQTLLGDKWRVIIGRLENSNLAPNSFRVVHLRHVIEHLENPHAILDIIWNILEPGGIMVVETPNSRAMVNTTYAFFARLRKLPRRIATPVDPPFHLLGFSKYSLNKICEQHHFVKRLCTTTAHGDPTWRFQSEGVSNLEFYGAHTTLMPFVHRFSARIGQGDNLLAIYQKPKEELV